MESKRNGSFIAQALLDSPGMARESVKYRRAEVIFTQGDPSEHVLYIQTGAVKLSVGSMTGRQTVVARLGAGEFFGEGCLVGQPVRLGRATSTTDSTILLLDKDKMVRLLHEKHAVSGQFIAEMLERHIRTEEQLINELFSSTEKRLARALVLLARYGSQKHIMAVPPISPDAIAKMTGLTSPRVKDVLKKLRQLKFLDDSEGIKVSESLLNVIL